VRSDERAQGESLTSDDLGLEMDDLPGGWFATIIEYAIDPVGEGREPNDVDGPSRAVLFVDLVNGERHHGVVTGLLGYIELSQARGNTTVFEVVLHRQDGGEGVHRQGQAPYGRRREELPAFSL